MKSKLFTLILLAINCVQPLIATEADPRLPSASAAQPISPSEIVLFQQAQQAYKALNFELIAIQVNQELIDSLHISHGVINNQEVEHHIYLNGPAHEVLQIGNSVSFFEQGQPPFTLTSAQLPGLLAKLVRIEPQQLTHSYRLVQGGRNRIAGRIAQLIRIVPKDPSLYRMQLWLDTESQLPLRLDLLDKQGEIIEQLMTVSLVIHNTTMPWIAQLAKLQLPPSIPATTSLPQQFQWQVDWLPRGMKMALNDSHTLAVNQQQVAYQKFSNGLVDISVYVVEHNSNSNSNSDIKQQRVRQGSSNLFSFIHNKMEITVVGELPAETAQRIAESVNLTSGK